MFSFLDWPQFVAYVSTVIILNLMPGADVLFICGQSLKGGRDHGIAAALGISSGIIIYVIITIFGVAELFRVFPHLFNIVKFLGIGYLGFLAYKSFTAKEPAFGNLPQNSISSKYLRKVFKQGVLTNLLNPKTGLFFFTFLPPFINESASTPVQWQLLWLGIWFVFSGTLVNIGYGILVARMRHTLLKSIFMQNSLQKITGTIFTALALKLLWDGIKR